MPLPLLLSLAVLLLFSLSAAALDVPLTLKEPIGVARSEEPITCGVPLPRRVCADPSALRLLDAKGAEVPAFFAVANRWWEDGSAKWVHVSLQRSVPANGEETLHLCLAEPRHPAASELRVEESPHDITVTTGPLRFRVKKQHFNLLDQVWLDESGQGRFDEAHALLVDRPRGARVAEGSHTAWASADAECTVAVESADPYRVVIRAEGRHRRPDSAPLSDFITRITAYRGKSYLTMSHVFLVRQGESMNDYLSLHDISLVLPLNLQPGQDGLHYRFGGSEAIHEGRVARREVASLYQHGPDDYAVFLASNEPWTGWRMGAEAKGKGHTPRTGWVDVSDGRRGMTAAVRDFWQMFPKVLKAEANGDVVVELYPDTRYGQPLVVYPGTARTHEVLLSFHEAADGSAISDAMAAFQAPLTLTAPPRWYCRDTQAFGRLSEADPTIYDPQYREVVETFERRFTEGFAHILQTREERASQPPISNEYGIINYGDGLHWVEANTFYWDDNYYDFPHALLLQFARTGDRRYLDNARAYGRHLGDVDNACWATELQAVGGPRVCPAIDHVRSYHDGAGSVSPTFNFYKNQSLFELWYLTGDRRYLETALLSAGYALQVEGIGFSEPRSAAHALISLVAAYEATGGQRYLDRGRYFWKQIAAYQDEHEGGFPNTFAFQGGLVTEGFRDWYRATGEPEVPARLVRLLDWMIATYEGGKDGLEDVGGYSGLVGFGWAWEITGDRRYLDIATGHVLHWAPSGFGNKVKDYGQAFRGSPYLLWWLRKDAAAAP